jgi:hypothetical protein
MKDLLEYNVLAKGFIDKLEELQKEKNVDELKKKIIAILKDDEYSGAKGTRKKYIEKVSYMKTMKDIQFFLYNFILAAGGMKT